MSAFSQWAWKRNTPEALERARLTARVSYTCAHLYRRKWRRKGPGSRATVINNKTCSYLLTHWQGKKRRGKKSLSRYVPLLSAVPLPSSFVSLFFFLSPPFFLFALFFILYYKKSCFQLFSLESGWWPHTNRLPVATLRCNKELPSFSSVAQTKISTIPFYCCCLCIELGCTVYIIRKRSLRTFWQARLSLSKWITVARRDDSGYC